MVASFKTNLLDWLKTKVYVKNEIDTKLQNKSDINHTHDISELYDNFNVLSGIQDELKNTRLVMGRLSDLAGEDGVKLEVNQGTSVYGKIISSNPEINTGENVVINFIVNGRSYEITTDANGRAILPINLDPGRYMLEGIVKRGAAGENPRLEQTRLLIVH